MKPIIADPILRQALSHVSDIGEVRDETGNVLGYLMSPDYARQIQEERKALYKHANGLFSDEELDRADAEGGEYTMADVMRLLER